MKCLSPGKRDGRLLVFIFHRVLPEADPLLPGEPDRNQFDWMVRFISGAFTVLPFGLAVDLLHRGELPAATACITFDDGYRDNFTVALPILQRYGVTGTFFISTGFLDGGRMWNDSVVEAIRASPALPVDWTVFGLGKYDLTTAERRATSIGAALGDLKYLPHKVRSEVARGIEREMGVPESSNLMMTRAQVKALCDAGMEIGAHTSTHPILALLDDHSALAEISNGKAELEAVIGKNVSVFAYPNGDPKRDFAPVHCDMLKACGFRAAATTAWGVASTQTNPYLVPRFTPWDRTPTRFAARCAITLANGRWAKA